MMGKIAVFFIIIFLVLFSLLSFFNKGMVELTVWQGLTYTVPVIALILVSVAVGILSTAVFVLIRDTRRSVESWQVQRQQKKEARVRESYAKGLDAYYASRFGEASELFDRVLESEPDHVSALLRQGDIAVHGRDFIKAKNMYMLAKESKPRGIEVLLSLADLYEKQEKWQDALKALDDILEIDSENKKVLYKKRDIFESTGHLEEAIDIQHKILKCKLTPEEEKDENTRLNGYKYEVGKHYIETGSTDKGVKTLKALIKTDKDFIAAYIALAEGYLKEGKEKDAEAIFKKGLDETSSLVFLVQMEDYFITRGEPGKIIDIYQKAIQKDRDDIRLQFFLAKLYYRLEMIDHASNTINAMDTTSFDHPGLHILLGNIHERRLQFEEAKNEFKKALRAGKPLVVPFCCSHCSFSTRDWTGRCPECKSWNTFILDINEVCQIQKRQSST
ncbi:MAG: tetratricopeptide repeat protein [Nitrospiraceae bacterium]|nr:MAG: tetratricopeptide repeat protein [Nitrospiraceae bacterium]